MLRLIHTQTEQGGILVDDIDDGLPNKQVHRLEGNPDAYPRDGYANKPKQPVYIPRTDATDPSLAGYIDLDETEKVIMSAGQGKIAGLQSAGKISVVSLVAADLAAPTVTGAILDVPLAGYITISGTNFSSVSPSETSVRLFGAGVGDVTLTETQILAVVPGVVSNVQIVIESTLIPGLAAGDEVTVTADGQTTAAFVVTV